MRLTASLGFEAKYLVASAIAVYPANRNTDIAVFRIAAITCGMNDTTSDRRGILSKYSSLHLVRSVLY